MKALIIDPKNRTINEVSYDIVGETPEHMMKKLMGAGFTYGGKLSSGDIMLLMHDWYDNIKYDAFMLYSNQEAYFGSCAVINFSIETGEFSDCVRTLEEMKNDVEFCTTRKIRFHRPEIKYKYFSRSKQEKQYPKPTTDRKNTLV